MKLSEYLKNDKTDLNEALKNVTVEVDKWGRRLFYTKGDDGAGSKLTLNEIIKIVEERFEQEKVSDKASIVEKIRALDKTGTQKLAGSSTPRYKKILHCVAHLWGRIFFNRDKHLKKIERLAKASTKVKPSVVVKPSKPPHPSYSADVFGNKTANLSILDTLFADDSVVEVPKFRGVSHEKVAAHIRKNFPKFDTQWSAFTAAIKKRKSLQSQASLLLEIQKGVKEALKDFDDPCFADFDKGPLVVRSTGREDTKELANAGGNESISNVPADKAAIAAAAGKTVASYFSMRSLGQRLAAGDDITQDPFMPILIQKMVGEVAGGPIPSSGVFFTTEGELGTPGVVQITSSFGHAEGVVTGEQASDSFYIRNGKVHQVVRVKDSRRLPGEDGELTTAQNSSTKRTAPSLNPKQLQKMGTIARRIEEHYKEPMDVEWTIIGDKFYLFQARPIPSPPPTKPSYLNPKKLRELKGLQRVHVIGAGGGQVRRLTEENTIRAHSAKEANDLFIARGKKGEKIEAVIIGESTANNSHEAGFFRERGIPLLHAPGGNYNALCQSMRKSYILVDTQEGLAVPLPKGSSSEELEVAGLRRHLLPSLESAPSAPEDSTVFRREMKHFFADIDEAAKKVTKEEVDRAIRDAYGWNKLDQLLNAFEESSSPEVRAAILKRLITISARNLSKIPKWQRKGIQNKIVSNAMNVWSEFQDPKSTEKTRKYEMHWLRASILHTSAEGVWDGDTLYSAMGDIREREGVGISLKSMAGAEPAEYRDIFLRSGKFLLTEQSREDWKAFVSGLNPNQLGPLADVFFNLGPQVVELFLNKGFVDAWAKGNDPKSCLATMIAQSSSPSFEKNWALAQRTKKIASKMSLKSQDFADPAKFDELLELLDRELLEVGHRCGEEMVTASGVECPLLAEAFGTVVSAFDDCIKGLSTSTQYAGKEAQKVENFTKILDRYLGLTTHVMTEKNFAHDKALSRQAAVLRPYLLKRFVRLKQKVVEAAGKPKKLAGLLQPSHGFSVMMAAFGSNNRAPERMLPSTLEDFFTLLHQSLETVMGSIANKSGIAMEQLPQQVQQVCKGVLEGIDLRGFEYDSEGVGRYVIIRPTIQLIEYRYPRVRVVMNAPLNFHSAKFEVEALIGREGGVKSLTFDGKFFADPMAGGMSGRVDYLRQYAVETASPQGAMMIPVDFPMQWSKSVAHFKWELPIDAGAALGRGVEHLQHMVDFLQLPDYRDLPKLDTEFTYLRRYPLLLDHLFEWSWGRMVPGEQRKVEEVFLSTLIEDFSKENLKLFLRHYSRLVRSNPKSELLTRVVDHVLDNQALCSAEVIDFLNYVNPEYWKIAEEWRKHKELDTLPPLSEKQKEKMKTFVPMALAQLKEQQGLYGSALDLLRFIRLFGEEFIVSEANEIMDRIRKG